MLHPLTRRALPAADPFDHLFRQLFHDSLHAVGSNALFPRINVRDQDDRIVVTASLPGFDTSALDLKLEGNKLTLSGKLAGASERPGLRHVRRERHAGSFSREVRVPTPVDAERVTAQLVDGILTVELPKASEVRARAIPIANS